MLVYSVILGSCWIWKILLGSSNTILLIKCLATAALHAAAVQPLSCTHRKGRFRSAQGVEHHWKNSPLSRWSRSWCFLLSVVCWLFPRFHCCLIRIHNLRWGVQGQSLRQSVLITIINMPKFVVVHIKIFYLWVFNCSAERQLIFNGKFNSSHYCWT
jgi:hypothetical protein